MPKISFTKSDLLERKNLKAAWYKAKVVAIKEELAKDKESTNYVTQFVVSEGENVGVPIRHWFSEKAMGRIVDFVKCFGDVKEGQDIELQEFVNREVMVFAAFDPEFKWNKIDDFRPIAGPQKVASSV